MYRPRLPPFLIWCFTGLVWAIGAWPAAWGQASGSRSLVVDGRSEVIDLWPAATIRFDATKSLSLDDVLADPAGFTTPPTGHPTLGMRRDALWVRVPLDVRCDQHCPSVFDIDFNALSLIDVHLLVDGRVVQRAELGNMRPFAERPLRSRSHSVVLDLRPGPQEIIVRIETQGTMILPITLNTLPAFHARALNEQMLQGLLAGLGACLMLYSLAQGVALRERMFLTYALMISGSVLFSLLHFGIGTQYLWTDNAWVESHMPALSALLAASASFLFIERVLASPHGSRTFTRVMKGGAAFTAAVAVAFAAGWLSTRTTSIIVSIAGLASALMGMPGAIKLTRQGDAIGRNFLIAWGVYFVATAVIIMVINGHAPVNFWTMHSFQIGATVDMLLFMRVLALRMQAMHAQAHHVTLERDAMRSLAHSDPLTGLPNRRGLDAELAAALCTPRMDSRVAVFMLDLDGFKPVNDLHGHDAGDELLVAVAQRLQGTLRRGDTVARLGGDEFVVMTGQLKSDDDALRLGEQLLGAFATPFEVARHRFHLGLTIGYAIWPMDAADADTLLKLADAAMYAGKASGKGCIRRGGMAMLEEEAPAGGEAAVGATRPCPDVPG